MHELEPFFHWLDLYQSNKDENSPFFEREYSEFYFNNAIYNFVIHPQWDDFGSTTLYLKILYTDYTQQFTIIEMIGEWNDCIHNDIMVLKREVIEPMIDCGINHFILIGENVLNFHASDDSYYEEWFQEVEDGWVALVNFREHVLQEFSDQHIDYYLNYGGELDELAWRKLSPMMFFNKVKDIISHRIG